MGIFDAFLGNAWELCAEDAEHEMKRLLASGEKVEKAYKLIRDLIIFTNKRLLLVDKQGATAKKVEYHSIPYRSITHFSIETAGNFDLDAELRIWISGAELPIQKQFNKSLDIYELQSVLATYVLK
ncbi:PH domain-containing protein [Acetivibrio cellulolyticus]|uniref:PH domain-containing protein n=1 Tax=Acetivibrio cellulolyticus TaxID=35830 RepID=UPI0001E2BDEC|nr:PH domain-containing protein [Acetivibrio cellulolyticus]